MPIDVRSRICLREHKTDHSCQQRFDRLFAMVML
jgi:hypothetical protein